jgi:hypothetical protein
MFLSWSRSTFSASNWLRVGMLVHTHNFRR